MKTVWKKSDQMMNFPHSDSGGKAAQGGVGYVGCRRFFIECLVLSWFARKDVWVNVAKNG